MGCGCKADNVKVPKYDSENNIITEKPSFRDNFVNYSLRALVYLLLILLLPIVNLVIIIYVFKVIMRGNDVDIKDLVGGLVRVAKKAKKPEIDEYDDDDEFIDIETLTEDDVVALDVEDITNKK